MNDTQDNWEKPAERFVAVLDIMGFKDRVARNSLVDIYKLLLSLHEIKQDSTDTIDNVFDVKLIRIVTFSDSIFIFSKDDSEKSLHAIRYVTSNIMYKAAKEGVPMKGAIAAGKLIVDIDKQIFFGQPLVDAHLLQENEVEYYGVVCHNSIEQFIEKYKKTDTLNSLEANFKELKTPLKSGKITHTNLNWFRGTSKEQIDEFKEIIKNFKASTSGKPRKYIDNTEEVFRLFYPTVTK